MARRLILVLGIFLFLTAFGVYYMIVGSQRAPGDGNAPEQEAVRGHLGRPLAGPARRNLDTFAISEIGEEGTDGFIVRIVT